MRCAKLGSVKLDDVDQYEYVCDWDTDFFRRLLIVLNHADDFYVFKGMLILTRPSLSGYVQEMLKPEEEKEEEYIRLRRYRRKRRSRTEVAYEALEKYLKRAAEEGAERIREYFTFGPVLQALTPEPEAFEAAYNVQIISKMSWIKLGEQAVKYVDSLVAMFGLEKAAYTMNYVLNCVTKLHIEEMRKAFESQR